MAGEYVNGIAPYNFGMMPFYNNYANSVALDSLLGYNGMGMPGMFSMDGSLFPGNFGGGMFPYAGGMNYEQFYKNMEQNQNFMYDSQLRRSQRARQVDFLANSPMEGIQRNAQILHEKIVQNEQQQIIPALNKYLESVKAASVGDKNVSVEQLIARADTLYKQMYNTSMTDDIRKYGNSSFLQGLYQTLSFGFADKITAEENISRINGQPVSRWESAKKVAGNTVGGATIGAASLFGLASIPAIAKVLSTKPGFFGAIGAVVGGLAGLAMSAFGKAPVVGATNTEKS